MPRQFPKAESRITIPYWFFDRLMRVYHGLAPRPGETNTPLQFQEDAAHNGSASRPDPTKPPPSQPTIQQPPMPVYSPSPFRAERMGRKQNPSADTPAHTGRIQMEAANSQPPQ